MAVRADTGLTGMSHTNVTDSITGLSYNSTTQLDSVDSPEITDEDIFPVTIVQEQQNLVEPELELMKKPKRSKRWGIAIVLLLKKIAEKSLGYKWMHYTDHSHYEDKDRLYTILDVILTVLIGAISSAEFVGIIAKSGIENNIIALAILNGIIILLTVIAGIIKGIWTSGDYPRLIHEHKYNSSKYDEIHLQIQNQLALNIKDRDSDKAFLRTMLTNYNRLLFEAPSIRKDTMDKYIETTRDSKISKPIDFEELNTFDIYINNEEYDQTEPRGMHKSVKNKSWVDQRNKVMEWINTF
jgi:hypothetical protein